MKILAAMSGGVDSSVAALLLKNEGHELIGVTMKLYNNETAGLRDTKTCCSLDDTDDARRVAKQLGFPYYVFNFENEFSTQVIDRFVCAYEQGRTPNPCIDCNRYMKFGKLYERASVLGCDAVATGHYAQIVQEEGRFLLKKGLDAAKDQSYVLACLSQEQLAHTYLPLGSFHKEDVRRLAAENGFYNANKADSQDICFVPDGDYAGFISRYTGKDCPPGDFVLEDGTVIGRHKGITHYTIGQRRGLGIAWSHSLFVKKIDPETNRVILSDNSGLLSRELFADGMNWIRFDIPPGEFRCAARIRYRHSEQPASVTLQEDGSVRVLFDKPQRAITPGQTLVLYDGDIVLGSGTIMK
ncbi:MAG: tRNA 2-thiouridine(34) synthase MnmA [Lachnospiraceae bacterium]|nr:tRNA 2-thiouridine(34) synthase MnmA [Lachnospiraceae bacterium]